MNGKDPMSGMIGAAVDGIGRHTNVRLDMPRAGAEDSARFRALLERALAEQGATATAGSADKSLGEVMAARLSGLASEYRQDQQHISRMLEKATRTGDPMHLMRAMLALHDYQIRVQAMSKTVAKAAGALDQLTKMQ